MEKSIYVLYRQFNMAKDKVKEMVDSWDNATRMIATLEVKFIEENKEKLSICTKKGERGVWIIFIKQEDKDDIFAEIKGKETNVFNEELLGEKSAFPCVFRTIESIDKENFTPEIYEIIEKYDPNEEIAVMFYLGKNQKEQCYVLKRADI